MSGRSPRSDQGRPHGQLFQSLEPGTRLDKYELLMPIAKGGMARVWAARQHGGRGLSRLVAVKTILPELQNEDEFESMFLDEANLASRIQNANVCQIYDFGDSGQVVFLAMEWVNGDSFMQMLRVDGRVEALDVRVAAKIVALASGGLHAAHELTDDFGQHLSVVHRDVSPHNILVSLDGNVKVTDFGIAKALGQVHQATVVGQMKGKLGYMAPEQAAGLRVDRRTDVFSAGCVLYEATTGRSAFPGPGEAQKLRQVAACEIEAPRSFLPNYPPLLERIVMKALAREADRRFGTAEQLHTALEEWLAKSGPLVTPARIGQALRERRGAEVDKRNESIKQAQMALERGVAPPPGDPARGGYTPSGAHPAGTHRALPSGRSQIPSHPGVFGPPPGFGPPGFGPPGMSPAGYPGAPAGPRPGPRPPVSFAGGDPVEPTSSISVPGVLERDIERFKVKALENEKKKKRSLVPFVLALLSLVVILATATVLALNYAKVL